MEKVFVFIAYVMSAGIIAFTYKFVIGIIENAIAFFIHLFTRKTDESKLDIFVLKRLKTLMSFRVIYSGFLGTVYSIIVFLVTLSFISLHKLSPMLLIICSFVWTVSVIKGAEMHLGILFWSSVVGLALLHLGFAVFALIFSWLTISGIGIAYYWGRVDEAHPEIDEEIEDLESE